MVKSAQQRQTEIDRRNINPTAAAVIAMNLWGARYAAQRGGSMDFWDSLDDADKKRCIEIVRDVREADIAHGQR